MKIEDLDPIIEAALREDMPNGDITSENILPKDSVSRAVFLAKDDGVLAGIDVVRRVFARIDPAIHFEKKEEDGSDIRRGDKLACLCGNSISLLMGERTALNFLQRMSGIATLTRHYVRALEGYETKILDTRKTTPSLRVLEKYAVKVGGGRNHRLNLSDMILIKDNHLKIVGSITEAVIKAREKGPLGVKIEVETTSLEEVREAIRCDVDMIMLDNMSTGDMKRAVVLVGGRIPLEASGNAQLSRIKEIAATGVNFISVGQLTHSYASLDISMEILS
ncbi:MAG: carboxylating nicotinate-nucleotide diphosphorylase [Candidatus Aminicenantes bacterium]|nr:carboxylating nicotinate-nucleotide diphosphorylase [Candidatus Aminicenantes bacterium]